MCILNSFGTTLPDISDQVPTFDFGTCFTQTGILSSFRNPRMFMFEKIILDYLTFVDDSIRWVVDHFLDEVLFFENSILSGQNPDLLGGVFSSIRTIRVVSFIWYLGNVSLAHFEKKKSFFLLFWKCRFVKVKICGITFKRESRCVLNFPRKSKS